jgi:uncharacterized UBP type Zn finger protein
MFGLHNFRGSCWVNAGLQGIFRIPEVQSRYNSNKADPENPVDMALQKIWTSDGKEGLKEFFGSVKHVSIPAGKSVGDAHELVVYLLDKLPWLDALCRFKIADSIECTSCDYKSVKEDTRIEFSLFPTERGVSITSCILKEVASETPEDSKCEKCSKTNKKQLLLGSFPKVLILHVYTDSTKNTVYSSVLGINKQKYGLVSIISYNGAHWWMYGRNVIGEEWYTIDDTRVVKHGANEFPLSGDMRMLIYYQLDE